MEASPTPVMPEFTVRRSARARQSRLTITDEGHAVVVLPVRAAEREAADLVSQHRVWIERHQRRIGERRFALAARPALAAGRHILFRGEHHRIVSIAAIDGRHRANVRVENGCLVVVSPLLEPKSTAELLEGWLRAEARVAVQAAAGIRGAEMGIEPMRISIRDQRTRWGSASRRGTLSFNWRLVLCPPHVLDYVVVHELAHLKVAGHSRAFWRVVDRHFSDSRGARRWLREHHDEIRHALD